MMQLSKWCQDQNDVRRTLNGIQLGGPQSTDVGTEAVAWYEIVGGAH